MGQRLEDALRSLSFLNIHEEGGPTSLQAATGAMKCEGGPGFAARERAWGIRKMRGRVVRPWVLAERREAAALGWG